MAHREHIIALEPFGKGILGTTLRYDYEVRDEGLPRREPSPIRTWSTLPATSLKSKPPSSTRRKLKDEYEAELKKLVKRKATGHTIEPRESPTKRPSNVIDLMDALKQNMKGRKMSASTKRGKKNGRKRKAG